jgi:hypothetical protein
VHEPCGPPLAIGDNTGSRHAGYGSVLRSACPSPTSPLRLSWTRFMKPTSKQGFVVGAVRFVRVTLFMLCREIQDRQTKKGYTQTAAIALIDDDIWLNEPDHIPLVPCFELTNYFRVSPCKPYRRPDTRRDDFADYPTRALCAAARSAGPTAALPAGSRGEQPRAPRPDGRHAASAHPTSHSDRGQGRPGVREIGRA